MGNYKMCMFFTRKFRIREAEPPLDVKEAFATFSEGGAQMTAEQLRQFLVEFQGDLDATISDAERIIEQILQRRHHIAKFTRNTLTLDDFHHFLFSEDLNAPIRSQVHQDMTAPLSHYFIYTGHNSYLTGNQLSSDCSDVPIIKALNRGLRVIELDIWPNSAKDDVQVLHGRSGWVPAFMPCENIKCPQHCYGRTLTTPVTLIKCLRSIKEHAFSASPYPVIITLEDHLTPDLQAKVARMVTETFGDMLFYPESQSLEEFPSPDALKYRIIISTKPPKEYLESKGSKDKGNDLQEEKDSSDDEAWTKVSNSTAELEADDKSDSDSNEHNQDDEDNDDSDCKSRQLGAPEYKRLIAIHAGKPKGGFKEVLKVEPDKVRRLSLSEQALEKATVSHGTELVRYLLHFSIARCLEEGHGKSLRLMQGMFRSNGGCGYVKKPDFLMKVGPHNPVFDPNAELPVKKTLKVRVYMGDGWRLDFKKTHFDSYSPPDFYVRITLYSHGNGISANSALYRVLSLEEQSHCRIYNIAVYHMGTVGIAGVPVDATMNKTKTIEDDWTPVWDEEFTFPLTVPELALLRIEVYEYDTTQKDDFGGQICLPVSELRPGIRAVPLHNRKGEKYKSVRLLMRFAFV
ncbi:hypothetical protein HHK36_010739 [Tetracentron sinense]|uniref:Phosphoinositide phospholipase C n=1 Tax=Tetracentron sinense TaxID=13715 RepID=A0A834Z923_TETSI|nr:hypothetical protein HHK36_010739 [Tetracentron sinense]